MVMKGYRASVVQKGPSHEFHLYCIVMEYYPLVLGVLMKNVDAATRNCAMEMLLVLLRNDINKVYCTNTCHSLCEGLKMIEANELLIHRVFTALIDLPYLNEKTVKTPNVNIKVVLIQTAKRILSDHSVGEWLSPSLKRKAVDVLDRVLSSSKSAKLTHESNLFKSKLSC